MMIYQKVENKMQAKWTGLGYVIRLNEEQR